MKKTALLVHLNPLANVTPLQGGYLKTFAEKDDRVRAAWDVEIYSRPLSYGAVHVLEDLVSRTPDAIGFSCYVWNIGVVRRLLPALRFLLPGTRFLLGGVEVMNSADRYVDRTWEDVIVANGEGERTFQQYLLESTEERPDWSRVGGITYQADGEHHTTEALPRLRDLGEVPSPWLAGVFGREDLKFALFETNRGCPYHCEYCFWGGAIGQKIHRLALDRVKEELTWIAKQRAAVLHLVDANFGIFEEDIELTEHIVENFGRYRRPRRVNFSSAKNHPQNVERISKLLTEAGLCTTHTVSIQTLSPRALELARRHNIRGENYLHMQRRLNAWGVASFLEMIWPLPGETLESFKDGIDRLGAMGAQSFVVYPLLLINNVGYQERREELGIVTIAEEDPASGAEIVVQTNEVPFADFKRGLRFVASVILLYNVRGLYATMSLWDALGIVRRRDVFDAFGDWLAALPDAPLARLVERGLAEFDRMSDYRLDGGLVHHFLHADRAACDELLARFVADHPKWFPEPHADLLATAVEYDLLARPYAYQNTPVGVGVPLERIRVLDTLERGWRVAIPHDVPALVARCEQGEGLPAPLSTAAVRLEIDHARNQLFLLPGHEDESLHFCHTLSREVGLFLPACRVVPAAVADPAA